MVTPSSPSGIKVHHFDPISPRHTESLSAVDHHEVETDHMTSIYDSVKKLSTKIYTFKEQITYSYLLTQAKSFIKAKAAPWSTPDGVLGNLKKAKSELNLFYSIKKHVANTQITVDNKLASLECQKGSSEEKKSFLLEEKERLSILTINIDEKISRLKDRIVYLKEFKKTQVGSRFTGYMGTVGNAILPGSSYATSTLLSTGAIVRQISLLNSLHPVEKSHFKQKILLMTLSSIASLVASPYIMPIIKGAAYETVRYFNPSFIEDIEQRNFK